MRTFLLSLFACFLAVSTLGDEKITLDELTIKVKTANYTILERAQKVYQAKTSIEEARGRMVPSLNLWRLAKNVVDPISLIDGITDVAPFLSPANWYVLKEREILFYAEKEGYRALWGNEVNAARSLFYKALMDAQLLSLLDAYSLELGELQTVARSRVDLGLERVEVAKEMEIRLLAIEEDKRNMRLLVKEEQSLLSYAMGLPAEQVIDPGLVALPNIPGSEKVSYETLVGRLLTVSPERKQYERFLKVIPLIKNEQRFSFLGGSSFSRGVAGGVFDNLPPSDGLGFGTGPALEIIDSQAGILELQKKGVEETLKRQLKATVDTINSAIDIAPLQMRRYNLAAGNVEQLHDRLVLGEKVYLIEYANAIHTKFLANAAWLEDNYRFLMAKDKLDRLLFWNAYDMPPAEMERIMK